MSEPKTAEARTQVRTTALDGLACAWLDRVHTEFFAAHPNASGREFADHCMRLFMSDIHFRAMMAEAALRSQYPECTASVEYVIVGDRRLSCRPDQAHRN